MWEALENILQGYLTSFGLSIFFSCFLAFKPKWSSKKKRALLLIIPAVTACLLNLLVHWIVAKTGILYQPILNTLISFSYQFIACALLFQGSLPRKILLSIIGYIGVVTVETVAIVVSFPLWSIEVIKESSRVIVYLHLVLLLVSALLIKRRVGFIELLGSGRLFALQCVVPVSSLLFMLAYSSSGDFQIIFNIALTSFIVIVNFFVFFSFLQQQKYFKET